MSNEKETPDEHNELVITTNTLKKVRTYAKLICRDVELECYGYLLSRKGTPELIARDAILIPGQSVTDVAARIDGKAKMKALDEIAARGFERMGCWHSHHSMGAWHSGTDDRNIVLLANTIYAGEELKKSNPPSGVFVDGNSLIARDGESEITIKSTEPLSYTVSTKRVNPDSSYGYLADKHEVFINLSSLGRTVYVPVKNPSIAHRQVEPVVLCSTNFAYSLVVSGDKTYAELAKKSRCNVCAHYDVKRSKVPLKIIDVDDDISFRESDLEKEVAAITPPKSGLFGGLFRR